MPNQISRPDPVRCLLFDFDGVIADTEPYGLILDFEAYEALGVDVSRELALRVLGTDGVESIRGIFAAAGRPDLTPDDYRDNRRDPAVIYESMIEEPMPGAREVLERLRDLDVKVGLVSTTPVRSLVFALDRFGLLGCFDAIVGGDMVERTKPAPDPWLRAMEFLGVDASQTIAIDDTAVGIGSAHAAGLYVVGFKGSEIAQDASSADEELADFASFDLDRGLPRRMGR